MVFYDNGNVQYECNYKKGKLHGDFITYYYDGTICSEAKIEDGKVIGQMNVYPHSE